MFRNMFKAKGHQPSSDRFKSLIHTLSMMSEQELEKVDKLLGVVFDQEQQEQIVTQHEHQRIPIREESLDDRIETAKATLKTEELEKRIEQFKQSKKES